MEVMRLRLNISTIQHSLSVCPHRFTLGISTRFGVVDATDPLAGDFLTDGEGNYLTDGNGDRLTW